MNEKKIAVFAVMAATVLAMGGCAAGGKATQVQPAVAAAPAAVAVPATTAVKGTTAVVTVSIQGAMPPGNAIGTVDMTLHLPPGVTAEASETGAVAPGVMVLSGNAQGSLAVGRFIPAAGSSPPQLRAALVNVTGFGTGEIATFNLGFAGDAPLLPGFSVARLGVTDPRGHTINNLTATLALQVK